MSQDVMWSFLVAMGAIAVAAVLDSVSQKRALYLSDMELSSTKGQLDLAKIQHDKTISDLKEFHATEKAELTKRINAPSFNIRIIESTKHN